MQAIPANRKVRLREIVTITDRFCEDAEFRRLCRSMAVVLCLKGVPLESRKAAGWAAAIVYSLAWVNTGHPLHNAADEILSGIAVSPGRLMRRVRVLRKTLGLQRMDQRWSTRRTVGLNPRTWKVVVDGRPCDIRTAPRKVQEEAYRRGIIPFLPDRIPKTKPAACSPARARR